MDKERKIAHESEGAQKNARNEREAKKKRDQCDGKMERKKHN